MSLRDQWGREIDYMRVSVTDRCNLRCRYCMPHGIECVSMEEILTLEEYVRVGACAAALGIRKIKITGGEPLVRRGCCELIRMLKNTEGIEKVTITTNGVLLGQYLEELLDAGIDGINISLDTLDLDLYEALTGGGDLNQVLEAVRRTVTACEGRNIPVKINAVSLDLKEVAGQLGCRYEGPGWTELLELARRYPLDVRFIEMMPIGCGKQYRSVDHQEIERELAGRYPGMERDERVHGYGPAVYYRIPGFRGSVGLISALHGKFCCSCNRVRLTSKGYFKTCLCYEDGVDLREILRGGGSEIQMQKKLSDTMRAAVRGKPKAHCFEHPEQMTETGLMARIGG
ncbi:MAG: GTP 3',8-cyclase MoaA [Hungatella sp.]|nr:GTP 3',8-cyclase MoaA [Hungatella sp.]